MYTHTSKCLHFKIMTTPNTSEDVEKLDHLYIASGNGKWYRHSTNLFGSFLKN